jgi:hypothetical protein
MTKVALFANVTGLATAVAGLCDGFEGPSAVDVPQNARGKCAQRGVHFCRGRSGGGMSAKKGEWSVWGSRVCCQ